MLPVTQSARARSNRSIEPHIEYQPGPTTHHPSQAHSPNPMQSIIEAPVTIYRHNTHPLLPTDDISPLGSGNIFTDIIILSSPQTRPRVTKCVKHPLDDRDWGFLSVNWSAQRLERLRSVLIEVQELRMAYWAQQLEDHQRFGRRETLAREHSIKIVGLAIADQQEDQKRREVRAKSTRICTVM